MLHRNVGKSLPGYTFS